ncbi:MAG: PEP-CTERM sorting domain-containing protein [Thermodesulfobacteriota bacterium]
MLHSNKLLTATLLTLIAGTSSLAEAAPLATFSNPANGWQQLADEDNASPGDGIGVAVGPGLGGQAFDAEYLFYRMTGSLLSIGLQTGFDLGDGKVSSGGKDYYAGDLALSFDSTPATYEYAVDFGLKTKDYSGNKVGDPADGIDPEGFYLVSAWNNNIAFTASTPFAMQSGTLQAGALVDNSWLYNLDLQSHARIVTIDLSQVTALAGIIHTGFTLGAHWTMSCGNDVIEGSVPVAPVPEPATLLLFGIGLTGIAGFRRTRLRRRPA